MKNKTAKFPPESRIKILTKVFFGDIPEGEMKCLEILIKYSNNNSISLSGDIGKHIRSESGITESLFSTALHRLEKRLIIRRAGKTIFLNPVYNEITELGRLIIVFE
jgi:hypothetical protein